MTPWPRLAKSMKLKSLMLKAEGADPVQAELWGGLFRLQTACGTPRAAAPLLH
jgi:hypothetical protein